MKLLHLKINRWRNFEGVVFEIAPSANLICLVGENGTGKSNVLELASALAHRVGISPGVNMSRGDPLEEQLDVEARFRISANPAAYLPALFPDGVPEAALTWNGEIQITAQRGPDKVLTVRLNASGVAEANAVHIADQIAALVRQREATHHLYLDSDRAYPPLEIHNAHYAEALQREWNSRDWKKNRAYLPTRFLYDDWVKYFHALESQHAAQYVEAIRSARELKQPQPEFTDPFVEFKASVEKVLPHLKFRGVDTTSKTLKFDSAGTQLIFTKLSGGEREIAFLVGQIERFKLATGLLLLDEPELHLNPDLIRAWIGFLRDTMTEGQVWISTHSIEAVEVAGTDSTYVLEREAETRMVKSAVVLKDKPVLEVLSAALGSPGFSISNLRFVFVEGERALKERERFHRIAGGNPLYRFVEGGGCRDVLRKYQTVSDLAATTNQQLKVGAILDRDFRSPEIRRQIMVSGKVLLLGCHEVENLFLDRNSLMRLLERGGGDSADAQVIVRAVADQHAGAWIQQEAYLRSELNLEAGETVRSFVWGEDWRSVEEDPKAFIEQIISEQTSLADGSESLRKHLFCSFERYAKLRGEPDFWKYCMGKQALDGVAKRLGFASADVLEKHILQLWVEEEGTVPDEVKKIREYLATL
jgi:ABC-type branched-subunit amino acid transport system ATPase component